MAWTWISKKHLIGEWKQDRTRLLLVVSSERTRTNKHKMKYRKFHLKHKKIKILLTRRVVEHWNRVVWRDCEVLFLEDNQNPTGQSPEQAALIDCALSTGFRLDDLRGLFQYLRNSMILWKLMYSNFKLVEVELIYFKCVFVWEISNMLSVTN